MEAFERVYTSSCAHALLRPRFEEYKGRGATVASDVTGHRGPKITKITYLGINIKVITSLTNGFY